MGHSNMRFQAASPIASRRVRAMFVVDTDDSPQVSAQGNGEVCGVSNVYVFGDRSSGNDLSSSVAKVFGCSNDEIASGRVCDRTAGSETVWSDGSSQPDTDARRRQFAPMEGSSHRNSYRRSSRMGRDK